LTFHRRAQDGKAQETEQRARTKVAVVVPNQTLPETPLGGQGGLEGRDRFAWKVSAFQGGEDSSLEENGDTVGDLGDVWY